MGICHEIDGLLAYSIRKGILNPLDEVYARNRLLETLGIYDYTKETISTESSEDLQEILRGLTDFAVAQNLISDTANSREQFGTRLMGALTPPPSVVQEEFIRRYQNAPKEATNWYYQFSQDTGYVRMDMISRNITWKYSGKYGNLDITINRSKPEKDPRDIAAAKNAPKANYPLCLLCYENTGYSGTATHPARHTIRPLPLKVAGQDWFIQYSPYGYYNEHCIVFNGQHVPMTINDSVFGKLFDILEQFPHYFVGSNADLPIVGGSILSHEHFQGGGYTFAMDRAPIRQRFIMEEFPDVQAGILNWPLSVIRLSSENRTQLESACAKILAAWRTYSDESLTIFAETEGEPHNTITPISRMSGNQYCCDLVLRNNYTTPERPLGLFHPNPNLHHIKKENIGLIEVMGLAVLPARLAEELPLMQQALLTGNMTGLDHHAKWLEEVRSRRTITEDTVESVVLEEIGRVFEQVLEDAGVFKQDELGQAGFMRFVQTIQ